MTYRTRFLIPLRFKICSIIFITSIYSCNLIVTNGHLGASDNIQESKKRGVFICEYAPQKNPYKINDSLSIHVKSAWLECHWIYSGFFSEKAKIENTGLQLIIITDTSSLKGYLKTWLIGVDFEKNIRSALKNGLITDFDSMPQDTIEWKVQSGIELADSFHKTIIGKFILKR